MMRTIKAAIIPLVAILGTAPAVEAQSIRDSDGPAEYPPASYSGRQYVDSKGCVFVRAGFDDAVTWVPRSDRGRNVICGQTPTFATTRPSTPAPTTTTATTTTTPRPTTTTTPRPTTTTTRPTVTASTQPATTPVRTRTPTRTTVTPRVVASPAPRTTTPTTTTRPAATGARTACPGASPEAQPYLVPNGRYPVRCGPQTVDPTSRVQGSLAPGEVLRVPAAPAISPPPGYRAAFNDDRLNPRRGEQTLEGFAQMALVWTQTVPRRLVDQNSGRDVTGLFPGLRYPYTSLDAQQAGRRVVVVTPSGNTARTRVVTRGADTTGLVLSTKSPDPETVAAGGARYVQVGTFGVAANAQAAAAVLQRLRLPVRIGATRMRGKPVQIVLAGPFASTSEVQSALTAAKRAGFGDAFARN